MDDYYKQPEAEREQFDKQVEADQKALLVKAGESGSYCGPPKPDISPVPPPVKC